MLVLTRKMDEQILIGDNIKITLLRVRGNSVRIGIEAPRDVRVVRSELKRLAEEASLAVCQDATSSLEPATHPEPTAAEASPSGSGLAAGGETLPMTSRVASTSRPSVSNPSAPAQPRDKRASDTHQLFVGSVRRDGQGPELRRSPLGRFLNAR